MSASETLPLNDEDLVLVDFFPYRIVAFGHQISRMLALAYEGEGLVIPEWRVLAVLGQAKAMAARDVAALTPMDKMAVSRAVASLEAKGLVVRAPHPRDRRIASLLLSRSGRALFERVSKLARDYERRLLAPLDDRELKTFMALLSRLEANAKAPE